MMHIDLDHVEHSVVGDSNLLFDNAMDPNAAAPNMPNNGGGDAVRSIKAKTAIGAGIGVRNIVVHKEPPVNMYNNWKFIGVIGGLGLVAAVAVVYLLPESAYKHVADGIGYVFGKKLPVE